MNENTVKQALLYLFNKAYEEESKLNEYNNGYASYNQQHVTQQNKVDKIFKTIQKEVRK